MSGRREFLKTASSSILASGLAQPSPAVWNNHESHASGEHLIRCIALKTVCPLDKLDRFYRVDLGLKTKLAQEILTVFAGSSKIEFELVGEQHGYPFYHFAFNIPENKILLAHDWQKERTKLIPTPDSMKDKRFPETVRHFSSWNAHSVFFYDPAGNILEYIARHDLKNSTQGPFSASKDIQCISEIALVADAVPKLAKQIQQTYGLQQYKRASKHFHFLGDENGLILLFNKGRDTGTENGNRFDVFPTHVDIRINKKFEASKFPYSITAS